MAGIGQFTHFVGFVVGREDGQNLGRVKVKALGYHDLDPGVVSADDLPWAPVVDGTYGAVSSVPLVGDWVLGAVLDGREGQHPIVLGRIPGYNSQAPAGTDTNGTEVAEYTVSADMFGKFPLHPAMGGEGVDEIESIVASATPTRTNDDDLLDAFNRKHTEELGEIPERDLDNRVLSSVDDQQYMLMTEEGCLQIVHHTGSIIQFNDNGDILIKTTGTKGIQQMVGGGVVEDAAGDVNKMVGQDYTLKVDMNGKMYFGGDLDIECENFTLTSRGETTINAGAKMILNTHANMQVNSASDMDIVSEQRLKIHSIDLTTLHSDQNGIYLYAGGANNNIDISSGSLRMSTYIGDDEDAHTGSIDILSANNMRIETKGTPADSSPSSQDIEDSEGFFDIKSSAGMRLSTVGDNLSIHSEKQMHVNAQEKIAMRSAYEDIYLSSEQQMKISSRSSTMDLQSKQDMRIGTNANGHLDASAWYIDDYVYMAGGGATAYNEPASTYFENLAPPAILAEIAADTRTKDGSGDSEEADPVKASAVNKEAFKEGNLVLHGAGPTPPKSQGEEKGYKQKDQVGTIPSPGNTNTALSTENVDDE